MRSHVCASALSQAGRTICIGVSFIHITIVLMYCDLFEGFYFFCFLAILVFTCCLLFTEQEQEAQYITFIYDPLL